MKEARRIADLQEQISRASANLRPPLDHSKIQQLHDLAFDLHRQLRLHAEGRPQPDLDVPARKLWAVGQAYLQPKAGTPAPVTAVFSRLARRLRDAFGEEALAGGDPTNGRSAYLLMQEHEERHGQEPLVALREYLPKLGDELEGAVAGEGRSTEGNVGIDSKSEYTEEYVTLDQAAAFVSRAKRTMEKLFRSSSMPPPDVKGGGGRPHEWKW